MLRCLRLFFLLSLLTACSDNENNPDKGEEKLKGTRISIFGLNKTEIKSDQSVKITPIASTNDWLRAGGNNSHQNDNLSLDLNFKQAWAVKLGPKLNKAIRQVVTPITGGGLVFSVSTDYTIFAHRITDGKMIWSRPIQERYEGTKGSFGGGMVYDNAKLYISTGYGGLLALDAASGKIIWGRQTKVPSRTSPLIIGNMIYILTIDNKASAYRLSDGAWEWSHSSFEEKSRFMQSASLAYAKDAIIVPYSNGEIYALHPQNGQVLWTYTLNNTDADGGLNQIQAQVIVQGPYVLATSLAGKIVGLSIRTGEAIFERDFAGLSHPSLSGNALFMVTNDSRLLAFNNQDGKVFWIRTLPKYSSSDKNTVLDWNGPYLASGKLMLISQKGTILLANPQDGSGIGRKVIGQELAAPPIIARGKLILALADGTLRAYD